LPPKKTALAVAPAPASDPVAAEQGQPFNAILAFADVPTDDGRMLSPNVGWRELPLSFMWMFSSGSGGHDDSRPVGKITEIVFSDNTWHANGYMDTSMDALEASRQIVEEIQTGVSVDLAIREYEMTFKWPEEKVNEDGSETIVVNTQEEIMYVTAGDIAGATGCATPAFAGAKISLAADGSMTLTYSIPVKFNLGSHFAVDDEGPDDSTDVTVTVDGEDADPDLTEAIDTAVDAVVPDGMQVDKIAVTISTVEAVTASAAGMVPEVPPAAWFEMPEADGPTALTIDSDGQVYGHAALWDSCHTGFPNQCVTAPKSQTGYAYFHLGQVETDEGMIDCGQITLGDGHAPGSYNRTAAVEHYDRTGIAVADLVASDGEYGIWVCGALRPDVPAAKIRELRAAKVSGDWRAVHGKLELVGLLAVNVPGFPVPRARVASAAPDSPAHVLSLVAAGFVHASTIKPRDAVSARHRAEARIASIGGVEGLVAAARAES
jgi:hypothetical protein